MYKMYVYHVSRAWDDLLSHQSSAVLLSTKNSLEDYLCRFVKSEAVGSTCGSNVIRSRISSRPAVGVVHRM